MIAAIKTQRLKCLGYIETMVETRMSKLVLGSMVIRQERRPSPKEHNGRQPVHL